MNTSYVLYESFWNFIGDVKRQSNYRDHIDNIWNNSVNSLRMKFQTVLHNTHYIYTKNFDADNFL